MSRVLALLLVGALCLPVQAAERLAELRAVPSAAVLAPSAVRLPELPPALALPPLPAAPALAERAAGLSPAAAATGPVSYPPSGRSDQLVDKPGVLAFAAAAPQALGAAKGAELAALKDSPSLRSGASGWGRLFDGAAGRSAALGVLALPLAAVPHLHAVVALAPAAASLGYGLANGLSAAFPLPETYAALRRGDGRGFPAGRAALGALGTLSLGLVNAAVLGKPFWGVMHVFIGLGMLAPWVIGLALRRRGPMAAFAPTAGLSFAGRLLERARRDRAVWATLGIGAALLAASVGLYAASAAVVPALLAAHLSAAAVADLLLWLQIAKAGLFVGVFAPDAAALLRGRPAKGFSKPFTAVYLASVAAFTLWGFSAAALAAPGPIRDQYLVLGLRNLLESAASAVSLFALLRKPSAPKR